MYEHTNEERARRALHAADVALAAGRRAVAVSQTLLSALLDPVVCDLDWAADELNAVKPIPVEMRPVPAARRPEGRDEEAERAFAEAMEAERSDPPAPEPLPGPQGVAEPPAAAPMPPVPVPTPAERETALQTASHRPEQLEGYKVTRLSGMTAPAPLPEPKGDPKAGPRGQVARGGRPASRYRCAPKGGGEPFEGTAGECIKRTGMSPAQFYATANGNRNSKDWEVVRL